MVQLLEQIRKINPASPADTHQYPKTHALSSAELTMKPVLLRTLSRLAMANLSTASMPRSTGRSASAFSMRASISFLLMRPCTERLHQARPGLLNSVGGKLEQVHKSRAGPHIIHDITKPVSHRPWQDVQVNIAPIGTILLHPADDALHQTMEHQNRNVLRKSETLECFGSAHNSEAELLGFRPSGSHSCC